MDALAVLAVDKGISTDTVLGALADALESAYKRQPGAYEYAWVTIDPDSVEIRVMAQELDEDGEPAGKSSTSPPTETSVASPRRRSSQVMTQRLREVDREHEVRGVRRPRGRHRHRDHPAERQPLHAPRPRAGRGAAAPGRAGALRAPVPELPVKAYIVEVRKTSKGP